MRVWILDIFILVIVVTDILINSHYKKYDVGSECKYNNTISSTIYFIEICNKSYTFFQKTKKHYNLRRFSKIC